MALRTLPSGKLGTPGTWTRITYAPSEPAKRRDPLVFVTCPDCGLAMRLKRHHVAWDGRVRPDIVCPMRSCRWTQAVTLEGWAA